MSLSGDASYELEGIFAPARCEGACDGWSCEQYAGHAGSHSAGQGWAEWPNEHDR